MSFQTICSGCGALSGPSVGMCPYCKSVLTSKNSNLSKESESIGKAYEEGHLDLAVNLAKKYYEQNPQAKKDVTFLLLFVKILFDVEAPTSFISGLLQEAYLHEPENTEVLDYLELIAGKLELREGLNDRGEQKIKNLLRRSPHNLHAHFILGTHLFWVDKSATLAVCHLEKCVQLAPNFLRAWGCLAAIYQELHSNHLALQALRKCLCLEVDDSMKAFFQNEISRLES